MCIIGFASLLVLAKPILTLNSRPSNSKRLPIEFESINLQRFTIPVERLLMYREIGCEKGGLRQKEI